MRRITYGPAAGLIKTLEDVECAAYLPVNEITIGSVTTEERPGNIGDVYYFHPTEGWSLNSIGLKNPGFAYYRENIGRMRRLLEEAETELVVSVAGTTPEEYAEMAHFFALEGVGVELNLGCPNVWGEGGQKPIPSYEPKLAGKIFSSVRQVLPRGAQVGIKISPIDDDLIDNLVDEIWEESALIERVVAVNTIPNIRRNRDKHDGGGDALSFRSSEDDPEVRHLGGLAGGGEIRVEGLRVLQRLKQKLLPFIKVVAVGGIQTGTDVMNSLIEGASGFQSATGALEEKGYFARVTGELTEIPSAEEYLEAMA